VAREPITLEFQFRNRRFRDAERGLVAFQNRLGKNWKGVGAVMNRELKVFLDSVAEAMARAHGQPWPGGTTKNTLSRRSGRAMQSLKDGVRVTGTTLESVRGEMRGVFYLRIHETGGKIRPRKAQYLTIPLRAALNSDGTPVKQSARQWRNTFVARSKNGNLLIFQRRGSRVVPLYALKREVTIPPRLGLEDTLDIVVPGFVDRAFDKMLKELLA